MSFPNQYGPYSGATNEMYRSNPSTPAQQDLHSFPQWETIDRHGQFEQHSPHESTPVLTPSSVNFRMQLEGDEAPPMVIPSQTSPVDDTPILLHPPNEPPRMHPPPRKPPPTEIHPVDAFISARSGSPGSSALASSSKSTGVMRTSTSRGRAPTSHPYYRAPTTPAPSTGASYATAGLPGSSTCQTPLTRSQARKQGVRFAGTTPHGGMLPRPATTRTASGSSSMPSPTPRVAFFGGPTTSSPQTQQQHTFSPQESTHSTHTPETPQLHQFSPPSTEYQTQQQAHVEAHSPPAHHGSAHRRRTHSTIPSDMHYSEADCTLTASMELPGVTPDNLRVTLGTCYFNHVKYVGVTAESSPPFGPPEWSEELLQAVRAEMEKGLAGAAAAGEERLKLGRIVNPNLRERRFGIMRRLIQVPSHTMMDDIDASLHHGVLTLRIYCGKPYELDDELDVPVKLF